MTATNGFTSTQQRRVVEWDGKTYLVPHHDDVAQMRDGWNEPIPVDDFEGHAMAYLMQDGNLGVPGGYFGSDTRTCAEVAIVLYQVMLDGGADAGWYQLDSDMSSVVNGGAEIAYALLRDGERVVPSFRLSDYLDAEEIEFLHERYGD